MLIKKLVGSSKYLETADINAVVGQFNNLIKQAFFINLNEAGGTETKKYNNRLKALITDVESSINCKYENTTKSKNYCRIMITTNEECPIKISNSNRRYMIICSSDELCGNREYFRNIYDMLNDIDVIRTAFDYFTSLVHFPEMGKFHTVDFPET